MDRMQEARVDLWKAMSGRFIPTGVLEDMGYNAEEGAYKHFVDIYKDPKRSVLLLANEPTMSGYASLWHELYLDKELDPEVLEFLLSDDFAKLKGYWQDELTNFIRNTARRETRPYLTLLSDAIYVGRGDKKDIRQVFEAMLEKQNDVDYDYEVVLCFCLIALRFDLMREDLLPLFYKALAKHKGFSK